MTLLPENIPFKISNSDPTASIRAVEEIVVGQLGQTLDGCIATPTGESKYINSDSGLRHLHSIRSAVDAVIVGVGSVNADDPQLTVRLCSGEHPTRVVIDPCGRVDMNAALFRDGQSDVIVITGEEVDHPSFGKAEVLQMPVEGRIFDPSRIVEALRERGLKRLLVEGGNRTLSHFLDSGVVDRLHLIVAPVIMGCGLPSLQLSPIDKLNEALRPEVTLHPLGQDVLFDCNFRQAPSSS